MDEEVESSLTEEEEEGDLGIDDSSSSGIVQTANYFRRVSSLHRSSSSSAAAGDRNTTSSSLNTEETMNTPLPAPHRESVIEVTTTSFFISIRLDSRQGRDRLQEVFVQRHRSCTRRDQQVAGHLLGSFVHRRIEDSGTERNTQDEGAQVN